MIRPALELQDEGDAIYFIANYHSMTSLTDAAQRRKNTIDAAMDFLACGLDPERTIFFKQSDVPEVTELTWLLTTITPMGKLERCHSYKDKVAKGLTPNHGLFAYPTLMAADILLYNANVVPVGKDQKQHVEVTRDLANTWNHTYGETFVIPEPRIRDSVAVVPGIDGQKMSKSYDNTIELFGEERAVRKKIMSMVMDSRPVDEPKPDADKNNAIQLLRLVADGAVASETEEKLRAGGFGYGDLKKTLFEAYWEYFRPYRTRREALANDKKYVEQVLADGAEKARRIAFKTLRKAKRKCGLD